MTPDQELRLRVRSVSISGYAFLAACVFATLIGIAPARITFAASATLPPGFANVQVAGALDEPVGSRWFRMPRRCRPACCSSNSALRACA